MDFAFWLRRTDCDWFGPVGDFGFSLRFSCLVRFALGFDVAELPVTVFYGQGYFHAHILGNCPGEGAFQCRQKRAAVFLLAPVHRACPAQSVAGGNHPQREVVVRDPQLHRALEQAHDHWVQRQIPLKLKTRTICALVNEHANKAPQHWFWIRKAGFEPFPDLAQRGQTELIADRVPEQRRYGGAV